MLEYRRVLNLRHDASDPWNMLANAVVEMAADDYRRDMTMIVERGLTMSDVEMITLQSHITEIRLFFESDWGYLLAHGLSEVIWERLQAEFTERLAWFNERYPFAVKHRHKLERKRKRAEIRWRKNKARRKAHKKNKKEDI